MQNGELLTTAMISYMNGWPGHRARHRTPRVADPSLVPVRTTTCCADSKTWYQQFVSALRPIDWPLHQRPVLVMSRQRGCAWTTTESG